MRGDMGMPLPAQHNMTVEGVIAVPPGGQHAVVRGLSMAMNAPVMWWA